MLAGIPVEIETENVCQKKNTLSCLTGRSHRAHISLDKTLHALGHSPQVALMFRYGRRWASPSVASLTSVSCGVGGGGVTDPIPELFLEPDASLQTSPSVKVAATVNWTEVGTLAADRGSIPGSGAAIHLFTVALGKVEQMQQMGRTFGKYGNHVKRIQNVDQTTIKKWFGVCSNYMER
jgi:hypothetical protein